MKLNSLLKEALNLSSVKTQLLALSKKYPGYANGLADYMDSGIPEDAYDFPGGNKATAEKFYDLAVAIVQKVNPSFEAEVDNGFDTEMKSFQKIGFFGEVSETIIYTNKTLGLEIVESTKPVVFQEAEYQGRKVKLGKVQRGGKKKFQVYVKNPKTGNVQKVSFGDTTGLSIKTKDPARRKSFRARHNCDNPGPRHKARYWSCRMWSGPNAVKNMLKK